MQHLRCSTAQHSTAQHRNMKVCCNTAQSHVQTICFQHF
jgi:hypothetical protein